MFTYLETILLSFVHVLSLEVFVFVASIIEEVIAPIPSPTVMLVSGSFASLQGRTLLALVPLALIGACGKTLGALVVYFISDHAEDFVMGKFGKFFKVSHDDIEKFGKKLGNGTKDYALLTLLRALPFIPSVLLSVAGGVLKVPLPLFITSTFFGTIVRDGFYIYAGFVGTEVLSTFVSKTAHLETYIEVASVLLVLFFVGRHVYMRRSTEIDKNIIQ